MESRPARCLRRNRGLFEALEVGLPGPLRATGEREMREASTEPWCSAIRADSSGVPLPDCDPGHLPAGFGRRSGDAEVRFASSPALDRLLRGAVLHDARAASAESADSASPETRSWPKGPNGPVWTRRAEGRAPGPQGRAEPGTARLVPAAEGSASGGPVSLPAAPGRLSARADRTAAVDEAAAESELRHRRPEPALADLRLHRLPFPRVPRG